MGLKATRLEDVWARARSDAQEHAAERSLLYSIGTKHLSLLAFLERAPEGIPDSTALGVSDQYVSELQDELTGLKRKYGTLERRYNSLARSKLGRITLKIWDRKRLNAPAVSKAKRS
jgi:hypothetical protein